MRSLTAAVLLLALSALPAAGVSLTLTKDEQCLTCVAYALSLRGVSWATHPPLTVTDPKARRAVLVREERLQELQDHALGSAIFSYIPAPPPEIQVGGPDGKYRTTAHKTPAEHEDPPALALWPAPVLSWRNSTHPETLNAAHRKALHPFENSGGNPAGYEYLKGLQGDLDITEAVEALLRRDLAASGGKLRPADTLAVPPGQGLDLGDQHAPVNVFIFNGPSREAPDQRRWGDAVCRRACRRKGAKGKGVPASAYPMVDDDYVAARPGPREEEAPPQRKPKVTLTVDGEERPAADDL